MTPLEEIIHDPVVQLLIIVVVGIGVFDAFKFLLSWIWKMIGGNGDL
jgi:hypothetical protein